jgi:magnesium chelatase family protein
MQIYSAKGIPGSPQLSRPFREVHSRTTLASLTGGGNPLQPGEISLAHEGVLFMDEITEFPHPHIESLRKPLEEGKITFLRNSESMSYPAKFMLVAAMNPCPCGYFGDPKKECRCRPHQIANYSKKISGPILDRIDLFTEVQRQHLGKADNKNQPRNFRESILTAKNIQSQRFRDSPISANSQMILKEISQFCRLAAPAKKILNEAVEHFQLSGRQYHKTIKVARTIADLSQKTIIEEEHIAEALQYRPDRHYNASV